MKGNSITSLVETCLVERTFGTLFEDKAHLSECMFEELPETCKHLTNYQVIKLIKKLEEPVDGQANAMQAHRC